MRQFLENVFRLAIMSCVLASTAGSAKDADSGYAVRPSAITVTTNSLEESLLLYRDGFGLKAEGPIAVPAAVKSAQRRLWGVPATFDWDTYILRRSGVPDQTSLDLRLIVPKKAVPPSRRGWDALQLGPITIGMPNTKPEALDHDVREIGFGAFNAIEVSSFTSPTGKTYPIIETVFAGPDFVAGVSVARGKTEPPLAPVNNDGLGGPAYSMQVVKDLPAEMNFYQTVLGMPLGNRREALSRGRNGSLRLPDGTRFELVRFNSTRSPQNFLMLMHHLNSEPRGFNNPLGIQYRGISCYSLTVTDLSQVLARARANHVKVVAGPMKLATPLATGTVATLRSPSGMLIEVWQPN